MPKSKIFSGLIHRMLSGSLESIPFHDRMKGLLRYAPIDFPVHLAVHKVERVSRLNNEYTRQHRHRSPEVNVLLGDMTYKIRLGDEEYFVKSPASIWIPAGLAHSANVISGTGYFVCIILDKGYHAEGLDVRRRN